MAKNPAAVEAEAAAAKAAKLSVTMTDGRVVEFGAKQKLLKSSTIEDNTVVTRLDFVNGETRSFTIPAELLTRFAAHGAEQKLGDAIAGEADIADAVLSVDALIEQLSKGEWSVRRTAGEFSGTSVLIQALVAASGKSVAEIKAYLETKTHADKTALRRSDKIRPFIEKIEAEKNRKSKTSVDTASLLDGLGL